MGWRMWAHSAHFHSHPSLVLQFGVDADPAAIGRYESARCHLKHASQLDLFGFRLIDGFVTAEEVAEVLAYCDAVDTWERRGEVRAQAPTPSTHSA